MHTSAIGKFLQKHDKNAIIRRTKGSGRKRKSTPREDRKIIRFVNRNREISENDIKKELNLTICKQTIRNGLK